MLHFDICCCTYNSAKWLETFFAAFRQVEYDKQYLHLYFTDNCSQDDTVAQLEHYKEKIGKEFGNFEILISSGNNGFGSGSNCSARAGKSEYLIFYNVDTAIFSNAFVEIERAINKAEDSVGAFELRQFPFEHPKYYDPITLKTSWASGATMVLRRKVFEKTGGFDESIFMYCEDVDLSWRIRLAGYDIQYVPSAATMHFTKANAEGMKSVEAAGQLAGEKILRLKFGTEEQVKQWQDYRQYLLPKVQQDNKASELAEDLLRKVDSYKKRYRSFYKKEVLPKGFVPDFVVGYDFLRAGDNYSARLPHGCPEITVVIRAFRRPNVLRLTLQTLVNQTYKNFQLIVVEDGEKPISEKVVEEFDGLLQIQYIPLNKAAGRCESGNVGLSHVTTKYACFLDDDDYLFADFMETNAVLIEENPHCGMFCSSSVVAKTKNLNEDGSQFVFVEKKNLSVKNLGRANFYADNPVPIQAVVFDMELFRKYGGLDVQLDAFEDWDLWIRYSTHCEIAWVDKALSVFRVPADQQAVRKRDAAMAKYRTVIYGKMAGYSSTFTAQQIRALFWTPDQQTEDGEKDIEQLKQSVEEIRQSNVWKIASPLRFVFGAIHGGCVKLASFSERMAALWGPPSPEKGCEDYGKLQRFVIDTQRSGYMRFFQTITQAKRNR